MSATPSDQLFEELYSELRQMASYRMAGERADHTLQPTALVHEVFMKVHARLNDPALDRSDVLAIASRAMRQVLVDLGRKRNSAKRKGMHVQGTLSALAASQPLDPEDLIALTDALHRLSEREPSGSRQAQLVECVWLGGMDFTEVAQRLGVSRRQAHRDWAYARTWLARELADAV